MQPGKIFVFLMLFLSAASALVLSDYLKPNESITQNVSIVYAGANYTLVYVNGIETFLIKAGQFVENKTEVELVLSYRCFLTAYPSRGDLEDVKTKLSAFMASRNASTPFGPAEDTCVRLTGQDRKDCVDIDTCIQACNLVMPYCSDAFQAFKLPFVEALLAFSKARAGLDGNYSAALSGISLLAGVTSFEQLNFNVTSELGEVYVKISAMQTAAANISGNKLFVKAKDGGYEHCPTIPFDMSSLSLAYSKVSSLLSSAACFDGVGALAAQIANRTSDRISYYRATKERAGLGARFDSAMAEYNNLTARAVEILGVLKEEAIPQYMSDVEILAGQFRSELDAGQYDKAGATLGILILKIDEYSALINTSFVAYSEIASARDAARDAVERAEILVEEGDPLRADVVGARARLGELEASLPINLSAKDVLVGELVNISDTAASAADRALATAAARAPSALAGAARGVSLAVLRAIEGPLAIREGEKRAWMGAIPLALLIIGDVFVLALAFWAWFALIWSRADVFLRARVLRLWAAIFAALTVLVVGGTAAVNTMIASETGPVGFAQFWNAARTHNQSRIFIERAANESAAPIAGCAAKIAAALERANITTTQIHVIDGICEETLIAECLARTDVPYFRLKYGKNATAFYTFYKIEAEISGDEGYFERCTIAKLIK